VYYKQKWPCCSGTLVQTVADYPLNICMGANDGLYVMLYTPSRVRTTVRGVPVELVQETQYPATDDVSFTVSPAHAAEFTLYLRIPAWVQGSATVKVNGREQAAPAGRFVALKRRWQPGDRVLLSLPQHFRTEAIDDKHPETVALMRGPVQYVALNPPDAAAPKLPANPVQITPQAFAEPSSGGTLVLVPLYTIGGDRYTTYFNRA
jgi:DUF1680 family protein